MSFLWGKNKKNGPPGTLPPAVRDISSSHGPDGARPPTANGLPSGPGAAPGIRDGMERRTTVGSTTPNPTMGPQGMGLAPVLAPGSGPSSGPVSPQLGGPGGRERADSDLTLVCFCLMTVPIQLLTSIGNARPKIGSSSRSPTNTARRFTISMVATTT
jgi:hypothetical protein